MKTLLTYETPATIAALQRVIAQAKARGCRVRVVGAQHSIEDAIYGTEIAQGRCVVVSMAAFDCIEIVKDERRRANRSDARKRKTRVRIEAGVHFAEAPYVDPVPAPRAQLNRWLRANQLDLIHLGGIAQQTVVGFLATGSSGGSWSHSLHDTICAVELVDGEGQHRVISRGDEVFEAAGVSLGLLGIIISVTLELEEAFEVQGQETFTKLDRAASGCREDWLTGFLEDHEYARLIWWPQINAAQFWRATRVIKRRDARANPYLPTGVEDLEKQVLTCVLYIMMGNIGTLEHLRAIPNKLKAARVLDYIDRMAHRANYRPLDEMETDIDVLDRDPFYYWTLSRFRAPRRVEADASGFLDVGVGALAGVSANLLMIALQHDVRAGLDRFAKRALLAAADELAKRFLFKASGRDATSTGDLRRCLNAYGDIVSSLAVPERHVGPIGQHQAEWVRFEEWWNKSVIARMSLIDIAEHLGHVAASLLVPLTSLERETALSSEGARWAELIHQAIKLAVYAGLPDAITTFFSAYLTEPPVRMAFNDDALPGLAMDKRINHNLVQTKFTELWIAKDDAAAAMSLFTSHLVTEPNEGLPGSDLAATIRSHATHDDVRAAFEDGGLDGNALFAICTAVVSALLPPYEERFRRQGAYSIEIYGGKGGDTFLLYPGHGDDDANWVRFNVFWFAFREGEPADHFRQFWTLLNDAGIRYRCHWGKYQPRGLEHLDEAFEANVKKFLRHRAQFDPDGVFLTDYWCAQLGCTADATV